MNSIREIKQQIHHLTNELLQDSIDQDTREIIEKIDYGTYDEDDINQLEKIDDKKLQGKLSLLSHYAMEYLDREMIQYYIVDLDPIEDRDEIFKWIESLLSPKTYDLISEFLEDLRLVRVVHDRERHDRRIRIIEYFMRQEGLNDETIEKIKEIGTLSRTLYETSLRFRKATMKKEICIAFIQVDSRDKDYLLRLEPTNRCLHLTIHDYEPKNRMIEVSDRIFDYTLMDWFESLENLLIDFA